ncbi:hypothetical protein CO046_03330 [Candidatus Peregrinibacteria bacterium CG_4_9_14_0_2_um_filter_53_11]|nr:MAG: hypothetical protein CO046_03330 [Candidatus Peregrinibacteria bacterium CG_4_9_14_0_2_um_filter_53_11]
MELSKTKIFAEFSAGIFGGTVLGIAAFLAMTTYGGNYGCWSSIDSLFGTVGYESCGSFGALTGVLVGALLAMILFSKAKITNYTKVAIYLLLGAFILPFLYGVIIFWPPFEDGDLLLVPPVILTFMAFSVIPSLLITGAINWRKLWKF